MRLRIFLFTLIGILAAVIPAVLVAQQEQDDVRGAFLTSRPKEKTESTNASARPNRRRPKPVPSPTPKSTPVVTNPHPRTTTPPRDDKKTAKITTDRLGLGLTLFSRDANGLAIRADPTHAFHKGDRVRVLLETNSDGYLYIFNTTDNGLPVMLYPNPELDEAGNYLQSHVPFEIPSSLAAEERLRWLVFDEHGGNERLYFVFSHEPLAGVPLEDDLISYCRDAKPACPWRPAAEVWNQIQGQVDQPLQADRIARYGKAQTDSEHQATTRGLGLAKDDPQPSLILMASSTSSMLVTTLDLVHQ
jgi:Domain of unknown function (DUF4384)